jgi:ATP-dependent DNA helicase RecG
MMTSNVLNGLQTINKIRSGIRFEIQHNYINIVGKNGDFTTFMKEESRNALKIFQHSEKWNKIYALISRYPFLDLSSRIANINHILDILLELEDYYESDIEQRNPSINSVDAERLAALKKAREDKFKADLKNVDAEQIPVQFVKGVGQKLAEKFDKIGIETCKDLLLYKPRDYIFFESKDLIKDLKLDDNATIFGEITKINAFKSPKKDLVVMNIEISDISGKVKIIKYFQGNSSHFYLKQFKGMYPEGSKVICFGKVKIDKFSRKLSFANPVIEIIGDEISESAEQNENRIIPVYPLTEGLSTIQLRKAIRSSIDLYIDTIKEFLPEEVLDANQLVSLKSAITQIHFPESQLEINDAAHRLIFNDFFLLQLQFMLIKKQIKKKSKGIQFNCFSDGLVDKFLDLLPFQLTDAQARVFYEEILPDMVSDEPMHRLIQGDVGAGKTVVAFLAILVAIDDGYQSAIMVPTEILAKQHFKKFQEWINLLNAHLKIKVSLLIGRQGTKERRNVLQEIAGGTVNIVVGTHAIIQDSVEFQNLGLVVIDEQHRFGVKQREQLSLKAKNKAGSTVLVEKLFMTATPIPRTLALALHGDLDMSEIDQLPANRLPIITKISKKKSEAHKLIKTELDKGNQAYIVFPLINESETLAAEAASVEYEKLKETTFKDYKIGLLHGKLNDEDKEATMQAFYRKELQILVSTTVIEVGIDVADATVILIESCQRFGLAQLHQLRGRVGRSNKQSYCLLSSNSKNPETNQRLEILVKSNNGFIVAQHDLQIRGAGDFLGVKQSGVGDTFLSSLVDQEQLLIAARDSARVFSEKHDDINKEFPALARALEKFQKSVNLNAG